MIGLIESLRIADQVGGQPEDRFLLWCVRSFIGAEETYEASVALKETLGGSCDECLLQVARRHRLIPLLHHGLSRFVERLEWEVPLPIMERVQVAFLASVQHNLILRDELIRLWRHFEKKGIPIIPFKGPVLAAMLYGNSLLRSPGDLDFLIAKQNFGQAKDILLEMGYHPYKEMTGGEDALVKKQKSCEFVRGGACVELHWAFMGRAHPFRLDLDRVRERLVAVDLSGTTVLTLSPEDLLLYLCAHGARHLWGRLSWVCDIALLLHTENGLAWEQVLERARTLRVERMLYLGLYLAHTLLAAQLPRAVKRRVQADDAIGPLAEYAVAGLFQIPYNQRRVRKEYHFRLLMREDFRDRIPYYAHVLKLGLRSRLERVKERPLHAQLPLSGRRQQE